MFNHHEENNQARVNFKLYALERFTGEWKEIKEIDFENGTFVFKGEHFGNQMCHYEFKYEKIENNL